ncbi:hypothetical protein DPSP01_009787 [Paraphaeosphaeria sporulosa]
MAALPALDLLSVTAAVNMVTVVLAKITAAKDATHYLENAMDINPLNPLHQSSSRQPPWLPHLQPYLSPTTLDVALRTTLRLRVRLAAVHRLETAAVNTDIAVPPKITAKPDASPSLVTVMVNQYLLPSGPRLFRLQLPLRLPAHLLLSQLQLPRRLSFRLWSPLPILQAPA